MKILLAINAMNLNMASVDFACYMAKLSGSILTGVFLENLAYEEIFASDHPDSDWHPAKMKSTALPENESRRKMCDDNILLFKEACAARDTKCKVHRDRDVPFKEIIIESRFADLLIIDARLSFSERFEPSPTSFAKKVLMDAECPVLIAPESTEPIQEVVFAYDGSKSSVFAMKQFTYIFPQFRDRKVSLIEINEDDIVIDEQYKIKEWIKDHYTSYELVALVGDEQKRILEVLMAKENCIVVMGAYGRGLLSEFIRKSRAEKILKVLPEAMFIAHC